MNLKIKITKLLPWVTAFAIFVYLFKIYSPKEIVEAMTHLNIVSFVSFAVFYFLFLYLFDSIAIKQALKSVSHPIKFSDTIVARGVTYLIMIVNFPASQAAFAYYLKRRYNMPIFTGLGVFFIISFVDLFWIITLAFAGSFFQVYTIAGVDLGKTVRLIAIISYLIAFGWIIFWHCFAPKIHKKNIRFISKLLSKKVFYVFMKASALDYIKIALLRAPMYIMIILSMYIIAQTFNAHIPFTQILCNVPLAFLIGALPITPGGLGTTNAALVELLSPHVTGPVLESVGAKQIIFAMSLLWVFANYFLKALAGCIALRFASKKMFEEISVPEEKLEDEASHIGGNLS